MSLDPKSTFIRACSGAIYILIIIGACWVGQYGVLALASLLGILGILEFSKLHESESRGNISLLVYNCIGGLFLINSVFIYPFVAWIIWLIGRMIMTLYSKDNNPGQRCITDIMAQIYIALPLALLAGMGFILRSGMPILGMCIIIWVNDTGAFLFGSTFGKHRLFERISPKKSWEGFWGGLLFSIIAGVVIASTHSSMSDVQLSRALSPYLFWGVGGIVISVFSTYGDLFESFIKRKHNVKDSGHLIPGHGGILDRIDSLLMVVPAMTIYWILWLLLDFHN